MLATFRAHPIRTAALLGALLGVLNVLVNEIGGVLHHNSHAALLMLSPFSSVGAAPTQSTILQTSAILVLEFAATSLVFALLLAAPVALIVLFLRVLRALRR